MNKNENRTLIIVVAAVLLVLVLLGFLVMPMMGWGMMGGYGYGYGGAAGIVYLLVGLLVLAGIVALVAWALRGAGRSWLGEGAPQQSALNYPTTV